MAMQKAILVTKDGERVAVTAFQFQSGFHEADVINYVTNYGAKVRTFRYKSLTRFGLPVFEECVVAYVHGRNEFLE